MVPKFNAVILDIEGTICPVSFVRDTLFPYFLEHLADYISKVEYPLSDAANKSENIQVAEILDRFPAADTRDKAHLEQYIRKLVGDDVKDSALKEFEGYVWKSGYNSGEILAPLYNDAIQAIKHWSVTLSKGLFIYSSGSIEAQKLLFSHVNVTERGQQLSVSDLNGLLSGYFDTTNAGNKLLVGSYKKILADIGYNPEAIAQSKCSDALFLSDNPAEVNAAIQAGMTSYLVYRPGNKKLPQDIKNGYKMITNFQQLF